MRLFSISITKNLQLDPNNLRDAAKPVAVEFSIYVYVNFWRGAPMTFDILLSKLSIKYLVLLSCCLFIDYMMIVAYTCCIPN